MRRLLIISCAVLMAVLGTAPPALAGPNDLFEDFSSTPADLFFTNVERGVRSPDTACGIDACATLEVSDGDAFLRVAIHPSPMPGYYTNTDVSQVDLDMPGITDSGPYTATPGHPVVMSARIRLNSAYDLTGTSGAVGTTGVVLWNSPFDDPAVGLSAAQYDHIGFTWASEDILLGLISGFAATSFINQLPLGVSRPLFPVDIHEWFDVSMVWSADLLGIQTVSYYVEGNLIGVHILPVPLQGLSLEIWTDNQEPNLCLGLTLLCYNYPSPTQTQSIDIDQVSVTQL